MWNIHVRSRYVEHKNKDQAFFNKKFTRTFSLLHPRLFNYENVCKSHLSIHDFLKAMDKVIKAVM